MNLNFFTCWTDGAWFQFGCWISGIFCWKCIGYWPHASAFNVYSHGMHVVTSTCSCQCLFQSQLWAFQNQTSQKFDPVPGVKLCGDAWPVLRYLSGGFLRVISRHSHLWLCHVPRFWMLHDLGTWYDLTHFHWKMVWEILCHSHSHSHSSIFKTCAFQQLGDSWERDVETSAICLIEWSGSRRTVCGSPFGEDVFISCSRA